MEAITDLPFAHILDNGLHKYFLKDVIVRFPDSTKFMMWRILKTTIHHNTSLILRLVRKSLKAGYEAIVEMCVCVCQFLIPELNCNSLISLLTNNYVCKMFLIFNYNNFGGKMYKIMLSKEYVCG